MNAIETLLIEAARAAKPNADTRRRVYMGAVAIRSDGTLVKARNGSNKAKDGSCHAEARVLRKCDRGSQVFVARVRKDGSTAIAKPCPQCAARLRSKGVVLVAYTVGNGDYEVESA